MVSLPIKLVLILCTLSLIQISKASPYVLPILKDNTKSQYFTTFLVGTSPSTRVNFVLDLGNKWSWFTCDILGYNSSSTYHAIRWGTPECTAYGDGTSVTCTTPPFKPSCTSEETCGALAYSPWSNTLDSGGLIEDVISIYKSKLNSLDSISKAPLPHFPFTCANNGPLKNLSFHTKGIVTLSRLPIALHAQISSTFKVARKFALCLPSTGNGYNGAIYFGGGPYQIKTVHGLVDLSKSLVTTPLLINPNSTSPYSYSDEPSVEYFIKARSIKVDGTPVRFPSFLLSLDKDGHGGTKISTGDPYTVLQSDIYKALVNVFVEKAKAMDLIRVPTVAPFGACFTGKNLKLVTKVPNIDIVLEGKSPVLHNKDARWRISGTNSMVKISDKVWCLGFVDGGSKPMTSIVIGGKQMEDLLVEIDLETSRLGITNSLLRMGTTCSQFKGI